MTVTRDSDFPTEIGDLFQAFNRCAEGSDAYTVLEASANLLIAAIGYNARTKAEAVAMAEKIAFRLPASVAEQWDREPDPADVVVPLHGN